MQPNRQSQNPIPPTPQPTPIHEHPAVTRARNRGDYGILALNIAIILAIFAIILRFFPTLLDAGSESGLGPVGLAVTYIIIIVAIVLMSMVMIRMERQRFLSNCLQIEFSNYAWLRDWANQVSADLRMPYVEIFVTQHPVINAGALGFIRPYNIILFSGAVRYLTQDELRVVVLHEMAHIKYRHTHALVYTNGFRAIPFIGPFFGWILNFFFRRAEYTADSLAYHFTGDADLVKRSLIKVHVGPDVASSYNAVTQQWQEYKSNNFLNAVTQTTATHPFLVRRLRNIDRLYTLNQQPQVAPIVKGSPNATP